MRNLRLALTTTLAFAVASLLSQPVHAQQSWAPVPAEYPAMKLPAGLVTAPIINSHNKFQYRSRLQAGSALGSNFGGHYALLTWGCGDGCTTFFILDELNGRVYDPGFNLMAAKGATNANFGLHFQPDSRLLVTVGCRSTAAGSCGKDYLLWTGSALETLLHEPANVTVAALGAH